MLSPCSSEVYQLVVLFADLPNGSDDQLGAVEVPVEGMGIIGFNLYPFNCMAVQVSGEHEAEKL